MGCYENCNGECNKSGDFLEIIWKAQRELNIRTFEKNKIDPSYEGLTKAAREFREGKEPHFSRGILELWIQNYTLALTQECAELVDCTNWKWWRTKVDCFDYQNAVVEAIDILHFLVSIFQVLGLTPEEVTKIYLKKHEINSKRQENDYLKKDPNDCRDIH